MREETPEQFAKRICDLARDVNTRDPEFEQWARETVERVCAKVGVAAPARLDFGLSSRYEASTGRCWSFESRLHPGGRIYIRCGKDDADRHSTLWHELAHWLVPSTRNERTKRWERHGRAFWRRYMNMIQHDPVVMDNLHFIIPRVCCCFGYAADEFGRRGYLTEQEKRFTTKEWCAVYWKQLQKRGARG